ncbi:MAG: metallophosphoesterase [Calditrichaeota bacterium]|nr:MAG: metallophosphoesterase [Calditrichota bacterium]
MMKIAIISDIHGNIHALEAVLEDLKAKNVDTIIANGDLINRGPASCEVLSRIKEEAEVAILGNHDDLIRKWGSRDPDLPETWFDDPIWQSTANIAECLTDKGWIEYLKNLPMSHTIDIDGMPKIIVSHGSPNHYSEGYAHDVPEKTLKTIIEEHPADIYISSYTHEPWERTIEGKVFLNTGAVGTPFNGNPQAQYLVLEKDGNAWAHSFCSVEYDKKAALDAFYESGFINKGGLSATIFHEELRRSSPLFDNFRKWADTQRLDTTWNSWTSFKHAFPEKFTLLWC